MQYKYFYLKMHLSKLHSQQSRGTFYDAEYFYYLPVFTYIFLLQLHFLMQSLLLVMEYFYSAV